LRFLMLKLGISGVYSDVTEWTHVTLAGW
jgi:hypothetical protein